MTLAALVLAAVALVTAGLTFRDPAIADTRRQRARLASAWLVSAAAFALFGDGDNGDWVGAGVLTTACVATGGRPALIMNEILPGRTRAEPSLMRRSRIGQVAVIAVIVIAAFIVG